MAQWEAGIVNNSESSAYPVLDFEDVQYIIDEEEEGTLLVLCRSLEGEESIIGYSYSYLESWQSTVYEPARPSLTSPRARRSRIRSKAIESDTREKESLYIAELFVSECERGLGLGDLLLTETLKAHADGECGSHLFVSSKNVSAVKCYSKFGFQRGLRPSGDAVHDSVMELNSCSQCVMSAITRYVSQIGEGTIGVRRRRRPLASLHHRWNSEPTADGSSNRNLKTRRLNVDSEVTMCSTATDISSDNQKNPCNETARNSMSNLAMGKMLQKSIKFDSEASTSPLLPASDGPCFLHARSTRSTKCDDTMKSAQASNCFKSPQAEAEEPEKSKVSLFHCNLDSSLQGDVLKCHTMTRRSSRRPRFHLTGMRTSAREFAEHGIRRLGGEVLNTDAYDFSCTHIISARPVRTEKFLCGLAEGKLLLHPAYIEESLKRGVFVDEAEFEWISIISDIDKGRTTRFGFPALDSFAHAIASSALKWRQFNAKDSSPAKRTDDPHQPVLCFKGFVAILFISESKTAGLSRLISAGGGVVVSDFQTSYKSKKPLDLPGMVNATHAFICSSLLDDSRGLDSDNEWSLEQRHDARKAISGLQKRGVECFREEYAVDLLRDGPDLDISGYRLNFLDAVCAKSKRKRSEQSNFPLLRSRTSLR